ncbi:acyl carrier protein [Ferruginibacter sp. SUN106]|uniref:acyl carrier protein n=1 Tax=Ferruginibacter sp. SUN106 TaxID=2978348 RepID=UPI003D363951
MGLDSVELIMEVEKHFSISIPDREAEKAYTVGKLVDCVANILGIKSYDFTLREKTFSLFKIELQSHRKDSGDFLISSKVADNLDTRDKALIEAIESKLHLKLPGIYFKPENSNPILENVKRWLTIIDDIDFNKITWKKFIDITLAKNLNSNAHAIEYKSKYEIYIAIMRITVDKIGVDYSEIGIEKIFTDDLGVD